MPLCQYQLLPTTYGPSFTDPVSPYWSLLFLKVYQLLFHLSTNNRTFDHNAEQSSVYFRPNQEPRDRWLLMVLQWPLLFRLMPLRCSQAFLWTQKGFKAEKGDKREQQPRLSPFSDSPFLPCSYLLMSECPEPCHGEAKSPAFPVSEK